MATLEQFQERLRGAVREAVRRVMAAGDLPPTEEGAARFTTIETLALAAGDAVSLEVFEQQVAECGLGTPHCPRCGFEGQRVKQRERTVQTRRGLERNEDDTFWREMKVGCLWSMTSEVSAEDPCPQLPSSFVDPERMQKMVREIKGFSKPDTGEKDAGEDNAGEEEPRVDERPGRPQPVARSVVASCHNVEMFGPLLASEAFRRRFPAAQRKAFVADGSESIWGVWRRHFSDYVAILDFIHALTYVYAAALAGQSSQEGWRSYRQWAQWVWSGQVERVIAALELRQQALGQSTRETPKSAPSAIVDTALVYLQNQRSRMNYPAYRKQGLPITSSYVESTVKQINRRMKGTEKFWSHGSEAMLTLVADHLSDTPTLARFWRDRPHRLTGSRCYHSTSA